ncbi:MAG: hypothetical protein EOO29_01020 [Comamonadaceae bacterium]|nr:MAG: hypothetical protein EOO29_01020 [Comamonadaceae bacterium]
MRDTRSAGAQNLCEAPASNASMPSSLPSFPLPADSMPAADARSARHPRRAVVAGLLGLSGALLLSACGTPSTDPGGAPAPQARPPASTASAPAQPSSKRPVTPAPAPAPVDARFAWPAKGTVLGRFDGNRNKGIDIGGQAGDPILASADGRVVFVGSQLRGYGQMVIVKHDETFISAYAHTSRILVKEKDDVRKGQKIAEMGSSGTDRVKLHFEIRRQGVAVNPQPYLDGRQR